MTFFLKAHGYKLQETTHTSQTEHVFKQYLYSKKDDTEEDMFVCTKSALGNSVCGISRHTTECENSLEISQIKPFGHVGKLIMNCENGHTFKVDTSSHIKGGKYLANLKIIIHGVKCSGLRYIQ